MKRLPVVVCWLLLCLPAFSSPAADLEVFSSGERKWELLLADMDHARTSICMDYFRFDDDSSGRKVFDVMVRKAREGVAVRLILEDVSHGTLKKRFYQEMAAAGVEVRYFTDMDRWDALSKVGHRDHRKIVVIDGRIGYLGGMNLADNYYNVWRDTHLRFEGPAVAELERIFFQNWHALGGSGEPVSSCTASDPRIEIVPGGPHYPVFLKRYVQLLDEARDYIWFQTPYFCPPDTLIAAMKAAVDRGVDVRLMVPNETDFRILTTTNQSFYAKMLEAGVRVYVYLPRFDHSKTVVCDDATYWVGSVNLDNLSLCVNYEIAACIHDEAVARRQKDVFLSLLDDAKEMTREEVESWSGWHRFTRRLPLLIKRFL